MRYLPKSPAERELMLGEIGVANVDELFAPIPAEFRLTRDLAIPPQMAESEIVDWFRERGGERKWRKHSAGRRSLQPLSPGGD